MVRGSNAKEGRTIRKRFRNEVGDESDRPAKWKEKGGEKNVRERK